MDYKVENKKENKESFYLKKNNGLNLQLWEKSQENIAVSKKQ